MSDAVITASSNLRVRQIASYTHDMNVLLEDLLDQEGKLQFTSFDEDDAWSLGSLFVERARSEGLAVSIDISTKDKTLFHYSFPGTNPDNDHWIERKKKLVNRFGHSSFYFAQKLKADGTTIEARYLVSEADYAPHGGCFPLIVRNVGIIGTITVSGLAQEDDHAFAVRVIRDYLGGMK